MKLLILDTKPLRRGAQIFLSDLARELIRRGVTVKKVYLYTVTGTGRLDLLKDDEVLGGNENHFFEKIPTVHPVVLAKLVRSMNNYQPDVVLLNGSRTLKYAAAAKWFIDNRIKLVYRVIDSVSFWNPGKVKRTYYKKFVLPAIDAAIGVSAASLADMIGAYEFNKPTAVIHRAIDPNKFTAIGGKLESRKQLGIDGSLPVVCFVGNLTRQKRPDRFVDVVSKLRQQLPGIQGWIIGDGPLRSDTEHKIQTTGQQGNIRMWGYQSDVGTFLSAADLLLLPSESEGLPGVVLEAGYLGVPAVATDVGGIRECLQSGKSGYIVPNFDFDAFVGSAQHLLTDSELRQRFSAEAKTLVSSGFTITNVATKYQDFLQKIISG